MVVVLEMCVSNFCWRSIYLEMAGVNKMNHKLLNVLEDGGRMRTKEVVRILILLVVMGWSLLSCTSYCVLRLAVTKLSCSHRCKRCDCLLIVSSWEIQSVFFSALVYHIVSTTKWIVNVYFRYQFLRLTDSVLSMDTMINLVQKLRQEKAECEETIKHKARVLERRVEEGGGGWRRWPGRWGWPPLLRRRRWP